ncbi:MAG TPA: hypothetical protein VGA37_07940 [Gemmatimonadales bacterium]
MAAARLLAAGFGVAFAAAPVAAQRQGETDSTSVTPVVVQATIPEPRSFSWWAFTAGILTSLAAHETGHVVAALVLGASPSLGFDTGRPVIYSGIDPRLNPHDQFAFSAAGMSVQLLLNEIILDWPGHTAGLAGEFERGVLASGIGTVLFYFTVGRNTSVSDVQNMADYSGLSKWSLTAIFGGVAATDVLRIALRQRYAHFFAYPGPDHTMRVGVRLGH